MLLLEFLKIYYTIEQEHNSQPISYSLQSILDTLVPIPLLLALSHRSLHVLQRSNFDPSILNNNINVVSIKTKPKDNVLQLYVIDSRI